MLTLEMIQDAKKTLEGVARVTPLYESAFINPNAPVKARLRRGEIMELYMPVGTF